MAPYILASLMAMTALLPVVIVIVGSSGMDYVTKIWQKAILAVFWLLGIGIMVGIWGYSAAYYPGWWTEDGGAPILTVLTVGLNGIAAVILFLLIVDEK